MIRPRIRLLLILAFLALRHLVTPSDGHRFKDDLDSNLQEMDSDQICYLSFDGEDREISLEFLESPGTERSPEVQELDQIVKEHLETEAAHLHDNGKVFVPLPLNGNSTFLQPISTDERFLGKLLLQVIERELIECDLVIILDETYKLADSLNWILRLHNVIQILFFKSSKDFDPVIWTSSNCRGYLFLVRDAKSLLPFANDEDNSWDYSGRFVFTGMSLADLISIVMSEKGRNTEKILGVIKDTGVSERWNLYTNLLFRDAKIEKIGIWKDGAFSSDVNLFPEKTRDLQGATIMATTFVWEPDVIYKRDDNGSVHSMYGTDIEVVTTIAHILNFTLSYHEPPNGEMWGDVDQNGAWAGSIGTLQRDETDIAFTLYVSDMYLDVLDFTIPYKFEMSCFIVQQEPPLPRWHALWYPFQPSTWLSLLIGLLITAPLLILFGLASKQLIGSDIGEIQSWGKGLTYAFRIYLGRSNVNLPKKNPNQIYVIFLWLYCMILGIAYCSNLTAFLTVKKAPRKLETISDLRKSGQVVLGIDHFYKDMFDMSFDPNLHHLSETYIVIEDIGEIFGMLRKGGYVYQGNEGYLAFIIANNFTTKGGGQEMRIMKECFTHHSLALGLQKHSPLTGVFNDVLTGMISGGLVNRYFTNTLQTIATSKEHQMEESDPTLEHRSSNTLGLDQLQGVFFITIVGWNIALFVFCMELVQNLMPE